MIAALLMLAAMPQDAPPVADAEEIVVTARLQQIRVNLHQDRKRRTHSCSIDRTSGDRAFDSEACRVTVACFRQGAREPEAMRACLKPRMVAFARSRTQ